MNNDALLAALASAHETAADQNKLNAELARLAGVTYAKNVPLGGLSLGGVDLWVHKNGQWSTAAPNYIQDIGQALTLIANDPAPVLYPHPDRNGLCRVQTADGETSHAKLEIAVCMAFVKAKMRPQAYAGGE